MVAQTVLIYVGLDLVGDGLMKLPFVRAVRAAFPNARLTWLAGMGKSVYAPGNALHPLVQGLLDEVIDDAQIGTSAMGLLGQRPLAGRRFDLIIDTQRRVLPSLVLRRVRHERFITAAGEFWLSDQRPGKGQKRPKSMVAQMLLLLELAQGRTPDLTDIPLTLPQEAEQAAAKMLPEGPTPIALAPGAGGKHKCWPLECYQAASKALKAAGYTPLFVLGPQETAWAEGLKAAGHKVCCPASVAETIALAKHCKAGIANDSGTGHMFAAADVPLISLFGPTSPAKFAPAVSPLTVITAQQHGPDEDMSHIPVTTVVQAVKELVQS